MLDIRDIPIADIHAAPYNPRKDLKPGQPEYEKLKKALNEFDLVEPLVWNKRSGNLVSGHQRAKILRERGDTTVPVSVVDLDDIQEKALNLALNKHSGAWEFGSLAAILEELNVGDFDMDVTGFDEAEMEKIATWNVPSDGESGGGGGKAPVEHECPQCHHVWRDA